MIKEKIKDFSHIHQRLEKFKNMKSVFKMKTNSFDKNETHESDVDNSSLENCSDSSSSSSDDNE